MQINKNFSILLILALFCSFTVFETIRKSDKTVLNIENASKINIDLNGNQVTDNGETFCLPNISVFTSNIKKNQTELEKRLNISHETALKLGFLSDTFAQNTLLNKKVKIKNIQKQDQNCKYADIFINNTSYSEKLFNSGLGFYNDKISENFKLQLEKTKKLNLIILNHKSNKYHKLDCKYGNVAHDAILIPLNEKPKDAKPCKFCHITTKETINPKPFPHIISSGNIKMFLTDFTKNLKPNKKCTTDICKEILSNINNSKTSIDISAYGWDNVPEIYNALLNAKKRNVKIRIAYDTSTNSYYTDMPNLIKLADESATDTPKILMHNKFIIIDNSTVITGSMNFSKTGFSGFNSNAIFIINSKEIAKIYETEFEQMIKGNFHRSKNKLEPKTITLNNSKITPLFSPKAKATTSNIIPLINQSKNYIYIPTFIITHDELSQALINAKNRGVDVKLIVDAVNINSSRSKVQTLRNLNIPVKIENYAGKLHSKSIIIDDKYIISGSMNFSKSGENKNDENVLIIEDTRLAKYYREFFEYLWALIPDKYLKQNVRAEGKDSIGSCSDGIDNDFDGKIDMADPTCR